MTSEVIYHNVSAHTNFHQNWFIYAYTKKLKPHKDWLTELNNTQFCLWDVEELTGYSVKNTKGYSVLN